MRRTAQRHPSGRSPAGRHTRPLAPTALVIGCILALTGCGISIPTDPDGTLQRVVRTGELRAGASPAGTALVVDGDRVSGALADLVEEFAAEQGARVIWTVGSEEALVEDLEQGDLDLAVGEMTDQTPWSDRASVTRPYTDLPGLEGRKTVLLLPLGENAFQSALETYLDEEVGP
ncbi:ABC-type amino acid transport substrate-binding protein [Agromyces terreus]|uniref:ABC-type amino acid transport substrate-binding protein n=1 Tax=Agromyces terreus TaxID=424795 RepID=A0A9X2H267_9MICO|nr:hypothetical protein [Agromyces terreus]MCP2371866.1 ABC-type amino acid transport substrate-binding protein [Agromyces terreus]